MRFEVLLDWNKFVLKLLTSIEELPLRGEERWWGAS